MIPTFTSYITKEIDFSLTFNSVVEYGNRFHEVGKSLKSHIARVISTQVLGGTLPNPEWNIEMRLLPHSFANMSPSPLLPSFSCEVYSFLENRVLKLLNSI